MSITTHDLNGIVTLMSSTFRLPAGDKDRGYICLCSPRYLARFLPVHHQWQLARTAEGAKSRRYWKRVALQTIRAKRRMDGPIRYWTETSRDEI